MMKMITLAALGLVLGQQALANYNCTNYENGNTLAIQHAAQEGSASGEGAVTVVLNKTQTWTGIYNVATGYALNSTNGQPVALEVTSVPHYGGGCRRCAGTDLSALASWDIYAKLTVGASEPETFTCSY
jgi:hypothetical protein